MQLGGFLPLRALPITANISFSSTVSSLIVTDAVHLNLVDLSPFRILFGEFKGFLSVPLP